jgi:hypothetical protein
MLHMVALSLRVQSDIVTGGVSPSISILALGEKILDKMGNIVKVSFIRIEKVLSKLKVGFLRERLRTIPLFTPTQVFIDV